MTVYTSVLLSGCGYLYCQTPLGIFNTKPLLRANACSCVNETTPKQSNTSFLRLILFPVLIHRFGLCFQGRGMPRRLVAALCFYSIPECSNQTLALKSQPFTFTLLAANIVSLHTCKGQVMREVSRLLCSTNGPLEGITSCAFMRLKAKKIFIKMPAYVQWFHPLTSFWNANS